MEYEWPVWGFNHLPPTANQGVTQHQCSSVSHVRETWLNYNTWGSELGTFPIHSRKSISFLMRSTLNLHLGLTSYKKWTGIKISFFCGDKPNSNVTSFLQIFASCISAGKLYRQHSTFAWHSNFNYGLNLRNSILSSFLTHPQNLVFHKTMVRNNETIATVDVVF